MKPKQAKKSKAPTFDLYDAVTLHSYRDPELFVAHFHLAGIDPSGFTLQEFCEAHSRLWDDAEIQKRMRAKIDAAPKLEFKVSEFLVQPWSSGYWRRALRDGFAYEVTTVRLKVEENQLVDVFGEIGFHVDGLKGA